MPAVSSSLISCVWPFVASSLRTFASPKMVGQAVLQADPDAFPVEVGPRSVGHHGMLCDACRRLVPSTSRLAASWHRALPDVGRYPREPARAWMSGRLSPAALPAAIAGINLRPLKRCGCTKVRLDPAGTPNMAGTHDQALPTQRASGWASLPEKVGGAHHKNSGAF